MKLQERGIETLFFVGRATPDLVLFVRALIAVGDDWMKLRTPETFEKLKEKRRLGGASDGGKADILAEIGDEEVKIIPNIGPYDGIFPPESDLVHVCIFSKNGELTREAIVQEKRKVYGDHPTVVFINTSKRKSVDLFHAHLVVDQKDR